MRNRIPAGFTAHGTREMVLTSTGQAAGEAAYRRLAADLGIPPDAPSLRDRDLSAEDARHVALMAGFGMDRDRLVTVPPRR